MIQSMGGTANYCELSDENTFRNNVYSLKDVDRSCSIILATKSCTNNDVVPAIIERGISDIFFLANLI